MHTTPTAPDLEPSPAPLAEPPALAELKPAEAKSAESPAPAADRPLAARLEALLISSPRPVPPARLAQALGLITAPSPDAPAPADSASAEPAPNQSEAPAPARRRRKAAPPQDGLARLADAVEELNRHYTTTARAFRVETVAGGLRLMTLPAFGPDIAALHGSTAATRLSRSAMETLAIIAYRQPVTRATLESIRGVACGETLKTLMDRRLVTIAGRAEELGRPMLYATTRQFLELFGLSSLKDLPSTGDLTPRA